MYILFRFIVTIVLAGSVGAAAQDAHDSRSKTDDAPTPVSGESWITHLSRPFSETSMGKTGALGPGIDDEQTKPVAAGILPPVAETTLSGADLYRLNCRGCHGANGLGAPPEINSVINPVRATSAALVIERMKSRGMDISLSSANELAKEAKTALLKRLHEGGENMPSFSYLTQAEIASITAYLSQLADMPNAAQEYKKVRESPERVGELVVKSTCHICHGATGPNPNEQQLYEGRIPPLETLSSRVDQATFIRKATHGLPILMGDPPTLYRGRMPVFYYLTSQEAADAYLYLSYYPPLRQAGSNSVVASIQPTPAPPGGGGASSTVNTESQGWHEETRPNGGLSTNTLILIAGLFALVVTLLAGGLAFTIREFARMSSARAQLQVPSIASSEPRQEETHLVAS
jgi:mono/diheme cytochrome c family protein